MINMKSVGILVAIVVVLAALAAWGHLLGMSPEALRWVQGAAGAIGAAFMAMLPSILRDSDGDGIPDILETPKVPPTNPPKPGA